MELSKLAQVVDLYEYHMKRHGIVSSDFNSIISHQLNPIGRKRQFYWMIFFVSEVVLFTACLIAVSLNHEMLRLVTGEFLSNLPVVGIYVQALFAVGSLYPGILSPILFVTEDRNQVAFLTDFRSSNVHRLQLTGPQCKQLVFMFKSTMIAHRMYEIMFTSGEIAIHVLAYCIALMRLEKHFILNTVTMTISLTIHVLCSYKYHSYLVYNFASACICTRYACMRTDSLVRRMKSLLRSESGSRTEVQLLMTDYLINSGSRSGA